VAPQCSAQSHFLRDVCHRGDGDGYGALPTDVLLASFNGDPTAATGYIPSTSGMLTIIAYPTAGTASFKVCNNTLSAIAPARSH